MRESPACISTDLLGDMALSPIRTRFCIPRGPSTASRSARNSSLGRPLSFVERIHRRGFADRPRSRDATSPVPSIPRTDASRCNLHANKREKNARVKRRSHISHSRVNVAKRTQQRGSTRKLSHVWLGLLRKTPRVYGVIDVKNVRPGNVI